MSSNGVSGGRNPARRNRAKKLYKALHKDHDNHQQQQPWEQSLQPLESTTLGDSDLENRPASQSSQHMTDRTAMLLRYKDLAPNGTSPSHRPEGQQPDKKTIGPRQEDKKAIGSGQEDTASVTAEPAHAAIKRKVNSTPNQQRINRLNVARASSPGNKETEGPTRNESMVYWQCVSDEHFANGNLTEKHHQMKKIEKQQREPMSDKASQPFVATAVTDSPHEEEKIKPQFSNASKLNEGSWQKPPVTFYHTSCCPNNSANRASSNGPNGPLANQVRSRRPNSYHNPAEERGRSAKNPILRQQPLEDTNQCDYDMLARYWGLNETTEPRDGYGSVMQQCSDCFIPSGFRADVSNSKLEMMDVRRLVHAGIDDRSDGEYANNADLNRQSDNENPTSSQNVPRQRNESADMKRPMKFFSYPAEEPEPLDALWLHRRNDPFGLLVINENNNKLVIRIPTSTNRFGVGLNQCSFGQPIRTFLIATAALVSLLFVNFKGNK